MKEQSDNKVPFVRMSQDDPLEPSSTKNDQVDSDNNNLGESNMIKEKVINNLELLEVSCCDCSGDLGEQARLLSSDWDWDLDWDFGTWDLGPRT